MISSPPCIDDACRGITAALAAWLEDRGGMPLFTLDGEASESIALSGHVCN